MKYNIIRDKEFIEVDNIAYEVWMDIFNEQYQLPDYYTEIDGNAYSMETMYYGCVDKGEELLPFILFYFEDISSLTEEGILVKHESAIYFFESFEEMEDKRNELIKQIENKK